MGIFCFVGTLGNELTTKYMINVVILQCNSM
ncbi:hypothetical protein ECH_0260 [Ehrlichia chaffeensis str. Arkansas]|uniref:Uncharacterized protein n=1 Tax=Ehrlichia chaffeensis (strain ATCC CRL-10679 / Arkansas) TaxID=205920 RepID=Q2GHK2_EHRCR|nr:hypothetical protein ECH_0260 [Ehrlichia chaffeensis str. Arkansas]